MDKVVVEVTNLKGIVPACKRCRKRGELFLDPHQPVLCQRCVDAMRSDYPHLIPLKEPSIENVRECLWNHDRECNCWSDGLPFPEQQVDN